MAGRPPPSTPTELKWEIEMMFGSVPSRYGPERKKAGGYWSVRAHRVPWNAIRHAYGLKVKVFNAVSAPELADVAADVLRSVPYLTNIGVQHGNGDLRPQAWGYVEEAALRVDEDEGGDA